ncbi:group II truncated hemoglobin [Marinospirillum alkaliphilum]|uniref:Hemoglobin n=1 Tax=Marinospirillum alkaliphilum DSM 21637 TaxID=1122209 RepID=A0A1K1Y2B1_9GAMM|nr:group II truncated hemoglobin [Marinospirillum alkaliphilum]SFX56114.1 hemoglobin [Marinospirillum alkaliphilum DSM 21637]
MQKPKILDPVSGRYFGDEDTSYQAAGGQEGIRRLVEAFYEAMDSLPEAATIRAMHKADLSELTEKLTLFLCGWLGGPMRYRDRYGPIIIPQAHAHLDIGPAERDAWMKCMEVALEQQPYSDAFKTYLMQSLWMPAELCRTRD